MVARTWNGGAGNDASNPNDWSPAGAPQPGDSLTIGSGTIDVSGNDLAGDTLSVSPYTASGGSEVADIATNGPATLDLSVLLGTANVTVAPGSVLTLNAQVNAGYLNVSGGTLSFIGTSSFDAYKTVLSDRLTGNGTLDLYGGNATGAFLEVNGPVGSGLTFNISSNGAGDAGLQIDHPGKFHGDIQLQSGFAAFIGLQATSADLSGDILALFNGAQLVDSVRLTNPGGSGLQVQQNSDGVMVSAGLRRLRSARRDRDASAADRAYLSAGYRRKAFRRTRRSLRRKPLAAMHLRR